MKRRLLHILTTLSLLVFVATIVLWVRSFFGSDGIARYTYGPAGAGAFSRVRFIRSERGGIILSDFTQQSTDPAYAAWVLPRASVWEFPHDPTGGPYWPAASDLFDTLSFDINANRRLTSGMTEAWLNVRIPYWAPALLAAIAPLWWLVRGRTWRRRQRVAQGRCAECGYDLRATPGQCPECGAAAVSPVT